MNKSTFICFTLEEILNVVFSCACVFFNQCLCLMGEILISMVFNPMGFLFLSLHSLACKVCGVMLKVTD